MSTITATEATATAAGRTRHTAATAKGIALAGAAAAVAASCATMAVAAVAKAIDVPMVAGPSSWEVGKEIPTVGFGQLTFGFSLVGLVLALALGRWATRPARTFVVTTLVLTTISFASPFTTSHITTASRVVLELTHVVAAAVVIPVLARTLARR